MSGPVGFRQLVLIARHELAVMLDLGRRAVILPVLRDGADAVRADRHNLRDLLLLEDLEILLGKLLEDQVIAQPADGIAGAFFFLEDPEAGAEVLHDLRERSDNLAALRIIGAHAAEPQAVLLRCRRRWAAPVF